MNRLALLTAVCVPLAAVTISWPEQNQAGKQMAASAKRWLDGLSDEQHAKAVFTFGDKEREAWHFVPNEYLGLSLVDMSTEQRVRAHDMLRTALSSSGYLKTTTIMMLERVLRDMAEQRGHKAEHRDPERYWFAVFGSPGEAPWGWRVQGHHLSLNFSVAGDEVIAFSPAFMGANPAEVREGPHAGLRVLAAEEDLARELLGMLDSEQHGQALIAASAPRDVILGPGREQDLLGEPRGLKASAMNKKQRAALMGIVREYANNLRKETARTELARIREAGTGNLHFAWAGSTKRGEAHYYRVHGPTFVIEYDNTQNDANHVHSVWHDLQNDFATDWLRQHYEKHR